MSGPMIGMLGVVILLLLLVANALAMTIDVGRLGDRTHIIALTTTVGALSAQILSPKERPPRGGEESGGEGGERPRRSTARVSLAGTANLLPAVEQAMIRLAGSGGNWLRVENALKSSGRWSEVLY